jgi:hypothetical protein
MTEGDEGVLLCRIPDTDYGEVTNQVAEHGGVHVDGWVWRFPDQAAADLMAADQADCWCRVETLEQGLKMAEDYRQEKLALQSKKHPATGPISSSTVLARGVETPLDKETETPKAAPPPVPENLSALQRYGKMLYEGAGHEQAREEVYPQGGEPVNPEAVAEDEGGEDEADEEDKAGRDEVVDVGAATAGDTPSG